MNLHEIIKKHYPEFKGVHPAADLFPLIEGEEFDELCASIKGIGLKYPLERTPEGQLLDGRNRLLACHKTGTEIRAKTITTDDPIAHVMASNLRRRDLDAEQRAFIAADLEPLYAEQAKARQLAGQNNNAGRAVVPKSAQQGKARDAAAKTVGVGHDYVSKAKTVMKFAPDLRTKVVQKKMSLKDAYKTARAEKIRVEQHQEDNLGEAPAPKAKEHVIVITHLGDTKKIPKPQASSFNRTNENVEWASWTWNPVTGCLHGCEFCYARAITHNEQMAANYPFAFEPAFYEHRLAAPKNTNVPKSAAGNPPDGRVFVGSMADLFGKWVPDEWIKKVFDACLKSPEWEYLFLTKWPKRYQLLAKLPKAWFGASVIHQADVLRVERDMQAFETAGIKWVSLEPMLGPIQFNDLSWCNLVVIGSQTATQQPTGHVPALAAHFDWVVDVVNQCREAGVPYYLKPNLASNPGMELPKSLPGNFV